MTDVDALVLRAAAHWLRHDGDLSTETDGDELAAVNAGVFWVSIQQLVMDTFAPSTIRAARLGDGLAEQFAKWAPKSFRECARQLANDPRLAASVARLVRSGSPEPRQAAA